MAMLWLEYKFPELIVPYKNIDQRIADHATVLAYSVFFTALIIWLFRRSYDREQQIIKDQKRELEKAYMLTTEKNKYIESLIRELHHRVKNNLQVVSSLMSLQSNRLEDDKARQALEEGKTRVDAMAMIHQKLYMDNELAAVDISEYLLNLSASLAHSHGYDAGHISTAVNLSNRYVDIDIAIPVGLIVNELVTNAFKHAFNGIQDPKIAIELTGNNGGFELSVCDNGRGIGVVGDHPWSFGMKLVYMLVEQLDAKIEIDTKSGTSYLIKIST
jgi:two-component sensor histidine kinase